MTAHGPHMILTATTEEGITGAELKKSPFDTNTII